MDSRYQKFLAISEFGSFSAAARNLHVTQPAVTLAVASLEHALGVRLYVRRSRPIVLTPEGKIVAESARAMCVEFERMQTALTHTNPMQRSRVGLIDSIARLLYDADVERTLLSGADVLVDNSRRILRALREGKIDLGVITGQPSALGPDITVRKLHNEEFVFVTASQYISKRPASCIDDWLATNPDSTTYRYFLTLFERQQIEVTPIFHSASMELLRDMAIAGKGTALLPRHIIQDALRDGRLQIIKTKPIYRPIWAVTRRRERSEAIRLFIRRIDTSLQAARGIEWQV
ncbi:MAG TPA: LysR family transcriptional regulator [Verrucomicrobiae bacterium]|nr:LysR family transcriptional regulator [Verrucomicrobiae bacterium]